MKPIRIGHSGDWHLDQSTFSQVAPAIEHLVAQVKREHLDLFILAGDLFVKREHIWPEALHLVRWAVGELPCPVVAFPGNHDASNSGKMDSCRAALEQLNRDREDRTIHIISNPQVWEQIIRGQLIQVACLPTPNKYLYFADQDLAELDSLNLNQTLSDMMNQIGWGLAAQIKQEQNCISALAYHGTVAGGLADSEMVMTTGQDIALPRGGWEDSFDCLMAAHLHKPQTVGRWNYCGSIAPLTFAQVGFQPSWTLWQIHPAELGEAKQVRSKRVEIPVAHQLLQCDITPEQGDPMTAFMAWMESVALGMYGKKWIEGAKVKVKASFSERYHSTWNEAAIRNELEAAESVSIITDIQKTDIRIEDDIKADASMDTLLAEYVKINPDLKDIQRQLLEFSDGIEAQISPDTRLELSGADYRPLLAEWTNWKQYATGKLDFTALGPLTAITGGNALGKSNAAEVEAFILFKYLRGSSTLSDVIKHGQKEMKGRLTFESRGKTWRVTRIVKRTAKGASADVVLEEKKGLLEGNATGWLPANKEDSRATQKAIEALVGTKEMYLATRYASQFDVDRILNMKPAELKDLIQEALPMKLFEHRHDMARAHIKDLEVWVADVQGKLEVTREQADRREQVEQDLAGARTNLKAAEEARDAVRSKHDDEVADMREAAIKVEGLAKDVAALAEKAALHAEKQAQLGELNRTIEALEKEVLGEPALQTALKAAEEVQQKKDKLDVTFSEWNSLEHQAKNVITDISLATQEANHILSKMEEHRDRLQEDVKLLDDVPCQMILEERGDVDSELQLAKAQKDCARLCQFLKKATESKDLLGDVIQGITAHKAKPIAPEKKAQLEQIRDDQDALNYDPEAHRLLKVQLQREDPLTIQKKLNAITEAKASLTSKVGQVEGMEKELLDLQDQLKGMSDVTSKWEAAKAALSSKQIDHRQTGDDLEDKEAKVRTWTAQVGRGEGVLEEVKAAEQQAKELEENIKEGQDGLTVAQAYARAVHRDGLPFLLLEQAVPALASHTNHFLGDAPLQVSIETGGTGKREEVSITFQDERGSHGLSEASGYQRMHLGASIRAGLIQIQADTMGTKVHHFFLDEGFGAYDQENLQHGRRMLQLLAQQFERVIFITHVLGMRQIADTTLTVIPGGDGSCIQVN